MRELLTADDLFSHLLIMRGVSDKKYILVEGDDDCGLIDPHLNEDVCETLPSGGKSVVLGAAELAEEQGMDGVGVVLDLDWSDLLYPRIPKPYVFYTDFYDIDATAYANDQSVIGFIINQADRDKLRALAPKDSARALSNAAKEVALSIGVIRFLSEKSRWELRMREFPTHLAIAEDIKVDTERIAEVALQRSPNASVAKEDVLAEFRKHAPLISDQFRYCSGHDLLSAIAALLRKVGGQVSAKSVGVALRSAFSCQRASQSDLFTAIHAWGASQGCAVLSCVQASKP